LNIFALKSIKKKRRNQSFSGVKRVRKVWDMARGLMQFQTNSNTMPSKVVIELCVALVPTPESAALFEFLGGLVAKTDRAVTLDRHAGAKLAIAPHMTLYQFPCYASDLDNACEMLKEIIDTDLIKRRLHESGGTIMMESPCRLQHNEAEGSFEIAWDKTAEELLWRLQRLVIVNLNKLRGSLLLERDPAGRNLRFCNEDTHTPEELVNIYRFGFAEGHENFSPHVTLGWIRPSSKSIATYGEKVRSLGKYEQLYKHARFDKLGVYALGPYGSCPQLLDSIDLNPASS
jgi:hypothetical protein